MRWLMICLGFLALVGCAGAPTPNEPQSLVDRSTLAVQEVLSVGNDRLDAASALRRARAVLICPQVFRGGFFFGGEGGGCVMAARDASGSWSSPAFYSLGSGSFGLQAGIQDLQLVLLVMNDRALNALLDSQLKLGADASLAFATFGGSASAATTTAVGADILAFARARGLYAGLTLEGSLLSSRSEWNRAYYGVEVDARGVVVAMRAHNPGSDPLRAALIRYGAPAPATAAMPRPVAATTPATTQAVTWTPTRDAAVQAQALPPIAGTAVR